MKTFICNTKNEFTKQKQECIPVGGVPPAAVAGWVSTSVHAWTPLGVGLETPLGVGLETPPKVRPVNFPHWVWAWRPPQAKPLNSTPHWCGPADLQSMLGYHPPGDLQGMLGYHPSGDLQGMLGYHLQCMLGYHPCCEQNDRDVQKY